MGENDDDSDEGLRATGPGLPGRKSYDIENSINDNEQSTAQAQYRHFMAPDGTVMTEEEVEQELELIYGAKHVILLFIPVTLCMLVVVFTIHSVNFFSTDDGQYLLYTPFHPDEDDSGGQTLVKSLLNSLIILSVVVAMTFLLILLYKCRCYYIIHGWIILSSVMLVFMFGFLYLQELLKAYLIPMDLFTTVFCLYNFGVTGLFMIHWRGPLLLQQGYLIISASLMSLIFIKYMPEWTLWLVLGLLAVWDLVAVLAPHGPLKMLVETAQERGEQVMPALIYSSTIVYPIVTMAKTKSGKNTPKRDSPSSSARSSAEKTNKKPKKESPMAMANPPLQRTDEEEGEAKPGRAEHDGETKPKKASAHHSEEVGSPVTSEHKLRGDAQPPAADTDPNDVVVEGGDRAEDRRCSDRIAELEQTIEEEEDRGVKLGLGDFIFYSVLVGKASAARDPVTTIACFIAILMGLFLTLAILVTVRKALPALPISIFFGLIFNFGTSYLIAPMVQELAAHQVFI